MEFLGDDRHVDSLSYLGLTGITRHGPADVKPHG